MAGLGVSLFGKVEAVQSDGGIFVEGFSFPIDNVDRSLQVGGEKIGAW